MRDKITLDASGQYRRDLGWKPGKNGGFTQRRFYLGRDPKHAERLCRKLEVLWEDILARFERTPGMEGERPMWTENTLAMAEGIVTDAKTVFVRPPEIVGAGNHTLDTELYGIWFARMVRDFRGVNLTFDHPTIPSEVATLADRFEAKAARLRPANRTRETLHQALDAYKVWLRTEKYLTPPEDGKEVRTSQTGVKEAERVERIKRHAADVPLSSLGVREVKAVVAAWVNRPQSSQGRAFAVTVCRHNIRCWKHFVHWLHEQPEFPWKLPPDLVWGRAKVAANQAEKDARVTPQQVATYTKEELRLLWQYGTDTTRVLMALALNCGFGIAEIGSLKADQVKGDVIARLRTKTDVYGQWRVWPVTGRLLAATKPNGTPWLLVTKQGRQLIEATEGNFRGAYIPNRWNHLLDRVQEDRPDFRRLSFNKLRKTAANMIREVAGGEMAGIFLAHGRAVKDDQLEVYTNRPFRQMWEAQDKVWEELKDIFVGEAVPEARISIGTIRKMESMHAEGVPVKEIAAACGVCETTVRDRLWGRTKRKQSPPSAD